VILWGMLAVVAISDRLFNTASDTVEEVGLSGIFFLMVLHRGGHADPPPRSSMTTWITCAF
jgi:hypothetical protein